MTEKPSRFTATPAQIDTFLRQHFAEDVLLRYQQSIGNHAVRQAAAELRASADSPLAGKLAEGIRFAADSIAPGTGGGPWPSQLVPIVPCTVAGHTHTDGRRLPSCRNDDEEQQ